MGRVVHRTTTLVSGIALAIASLVASPLSASADPAVAVIVVLRDGADAPGAAAAHGRAYGADVSFVYTSALRGYAARVPADRLARLASDPDVAFVSEDRAVSTTDGHAGELPYGVDRIDGEASTKAAANNAGPAIAVIDTGSGPHSDLNIAGGKNCSTGKSYNDGHGHGTHVAGTIAAKKNAAGVVGVLPGAPIYSVRVLNNAGSGTWSSVICGVDWVTANASAKNIVVANMSLGGGGTDGGDCATTTEALQKAICSSVGAGVTYVVAAGNDNADLKGFVPAAYDQVLSVTAIADFNGAAGGGAAATCRADVDDTAADFSNFTTKGHADEAHTIAAPGVCIKSTWKGGGYNTISGTSMASPHAAGTAAVCIASGACAGLSPSGIIAKLRTDAAARLPSYGFAEDAHQVTAAGSRYYGHLIWAGGY